MNLLLQQALAAPGAPGSMAAPLHPSADAALWRREWTLAQCLACSTATPAEPSLPRHTAPERTELERCGMPAGAQPSGVAAPPVPAPSPSPEPQEAWLPREPADAAAEPERAPVRVHVDPAAGDGLRIWLGIDGQPQHVSHLAEATLAGLREALQGHSQRIETLVCNGSLLFTATGAASTMRRIGPFPDTSKDTP